MSYSRVPQSHHDIEMGFLYIRMTIIVGEMHEFLYIKIEFTPIAPSFIRLWHQPLKSLYSGNVYELASASLTSLLQIICKNLHYLLIHLHHKGKFGGWMVRGNGEGMSFNLEWCVHEMGMGEDWPVIGEATKVPYPNRSR